MTKEKRLLQRMIALVLIAALMWQTDSMRFFTTAYAAETENLLDENSDVLLENELTDSDIVSTTENIPLTIQGEVESLRTQDEKHFRMSDGSYMAVSFGIPVHYQNAEGEWEEIDNRLVLSEDQEAYQTYNLQTNTSFALSLGSGSLFETSYGDTSVSMSLLDTTNANDLMKSVTTPVTVPKQSLVALDMEAISVVGQELQVQTLNQEVLEEIAQSELLVFDRAAMADISVEVGDILSASGSLSNMNTSEKGWTMEDILPENIQDSLLYEDVFPGVDLLYTKYSHNVKEQIIVNTPKESYRYDFKLSLTGVEAALNADGSVSLQDVDTGEEIYYIPAPYMEDANGRRSYDVEYVLSSVTDGVVLTLIADADWMNDSERAFPVAIDPTLIVKGGTGDRTIYASYAAEGAPNTPNYGETFIGYTTYQSRKEYQAFAGFEELPKIPEGMTVVKADFQMIQSWYDGLNCEELGIGVYEVTESKPSTVNYFDWIYGITWNNRPEFNDDNMIDYTYVSLSSVGQVHRWDITELVKKWYIEGSTSRAIAMTMLPGHYDSTHHAEAGFYEYSSVYPPILAVYYRDNVGIEPYYTYQTIGVGNAGAAYIADATGQLRVVNPLVSYASTINPFSLSLVYNLDYFMETDDLDYQPPTKMGITYEAAKNSQGNIAMKLGPGWTLNIIQTMHAETIGDTEYLCYTDGDGTKHYFIADDKRNEEDDSDKVFYYDEDGLGLKAEITNATAGNFVMYDDNGSQWTFTNRRLTKISNETGNAYVISWNSAGKITMVVQVNRGKAPTKVAEFTYSGDYVSAITDAAGNTYSITYSSGRLWNIYLNGNNYCYYDYQSNSNRLYRMIDDEKTYEIEFGISCGRISSYREFSRQEIGDAVYISYPNYSKTVYRTTGANRIKGDGDDLFTSYLFDYAGRTINAYTTDAANNLLGATNAAYLDTEVTKTENESGNITTTVSKKANRTEKIGSMGVSNPTMFHNGGCENAGWTLLANTIGVRTASYDNSVHRTGNYSLKMVSQNTDGAYYASSDTLSLKAGDTYTVSAYVRSSDCTSIISEGIALEVKDTAGNWFYGRNLSYITSESIDDGWTRIHVTFTALTTGVHTIYIHAEGTVGTFYIDDVQVEKGEAPGVLNLLKNGSMETDPCGWNGFNGAGYSAGSGWNGSKSMQIIGNPEKEAYIRQDVSINLPATETFVLSGWAKANSVPDNVNKHEDPLQDIHKQFGLRARILYADNTVEYHYIPFNPEVSEWQFVSLTIVPKIENKQTIIKSIRVICTFEGNANVAYFDNISLVREAAQTLKYNDDGELLSVTTPGLKADENSYQGGNLIGTQTGGNGTYSYTYDTTYSHRLTAVTDGILTQTMGYDGVGNVSSTTLKSNKATETLHITTSATYTNDNNLLATVTDAAGNTVQYIYDNAQDKMYGLPSVVVDGKGNRKEIYYDELGRIVGDYTADRVEMMYSYTDGLLTNIEKENLTGGTQIYEMLYDAYGNRIGFQIGERTLATYSYGANNGYLTDLNYGNGQSVEYTYDILGRVSREMFSTGRTVDYVYNSNGQVYSVADSVSGTVYYTYDSLGRLIYVEDEARGIRYQYQYNANNQMVGMEICVKDWSSTAQEYHYNGQNNAEKIDGISDGTLTQMQMVTGDMIERGVDALQRLESRLTADGYQENYSYAPGTEANTTTTLVSGKQDVLDETIINELQYTYDSVGNITRIYDAVTGQSVEYFYDDLNQLTSASYSNGREENYTYDAVGNLLTFQSGNKSHIYTYGDSDWMDMLTVVDGVSLTYDAIGNPLSYYNGSSYTMTWTEGRKLASVTTEDGTTSYLYNADGLRFKKINPDGSYILYMTTEGVIIGEKHYTSANVLTMNVRYTFDENGSVCGYSTSTDGTTWTDYYFIRNLQGDVLQVFRESDTVIVAEYTYDSWGNILSATGEKADENPFRYRGYYYDEETGFYYLRSRYYDPEIGRFINADGFVSTGQGILGNNMYAYCGNNPVNNIDYDGQRPVSLLDNDLIIDVTAVETSVDVTEKLDSAMEENASALGEYYDNHNYIETVDYFINKVKPGGDWDFKSQDDWALDACTTYVYHGIELRYDDLGNIHYGYVGRVIFSSVTLLLAGGAVQIYTGTSDFSYWKTNFDDPRDQWAILLGCKLWDTEVLQ